MSSVKRRINSTGRKRIAHEDVRVSLIVPKDGRPLVAELTLALDKLDFPPTALIVFEAYQRSTAMRFERGTVLEPLAPEPLILSELDPAASVMFRLKVVDGETGSGRILGAADRLRPASDEQDDGRKSLFPIDQRDIGSEIWRVDLDQSPRLVLNYNVAGLYDRLKSDPLVQGVLLPAALRTVLAKLASDAVADEEDETDWRNDWLKFCREELRMPDPAELTEEGRDDWVADGVKRFCASKDFLTRIRHHSSEGL